MRTIAVTIFVEIEDNTNPQEAADEVFEIIGNEPLEKIYSTIRVEWSGRGESNVRSRNDWD